MTVPEFRAVMAAIRRREAGRQFRMMYAVFNGAAPCVSGKTQAFDAEAKRLMDEVMGRDAKKKKNSVFKTLLAKALPFTPKP